MGVHLSHPVTIQDGCGNKDIRVRQSPGHGLLPKARVLWREERVLGVEALSGQELFVRKDPLVRHAELFRHHPLWGQHSVLGHGPQHTAGPLPWRGLFLG